MDFSKCLIDFTKCPPSDKLCDFFPELGAFPEFRNCTDTEIKISIAITDMDSPFTKISDRGSMLSSLFSYLNIPVETEEEKRFFEDVLQYKHEKIADCKSRYIQMQHSTDWTLWLTVNETFNFLIFESTRPKDYDETTDKYVARRVKIKDDLKKTGNDLKELEAKIFPESKSAREAAQRHSSRMIVSYPEKYAQERSVI